MLLQPTARAATAPPSDQATSLRRMRDSIDASRPAAEKDLRCRTVVLLGGKGGVGKSNIAASLAVSLAEAGAKVGLLDAAPGLGNVDFLCGVNGYWNLAHVVTGARRLDEVVLAGPGGIHVLAGVDTIDQLRDCPPAAQNHVLRQLADFESSLDYLLLDAGPVGTPLVRQLAASAHDLLLVTTPEPTSMASTYATLKHLARQDAATMSLVVNMVDGPAQGEQILERIQQTARLFLQRQLGGAGMIPFDPAVPQAVVARTPFSLFQPSCPAAQAVRGLVRRLREQSGWSRPSHRFFARLWEHLQQEKRPRT